MIENIEQAKKHLKEIIGFYKLNDKNNYDYTDKDLISIRIVFEEIERLNNIIKELDKQNKELGAELSLTSDKYEKKLFIKEKIINKAIDKLNNMKDTYYESNMANDMQNIFDLLDILKGADKE